MGYWGTMPRSGDAPHDDFTYVQDAASRALDKLFDKNDLARQNPNRPDRLWSSLGSLQLHLDCGLPVMVKTLKRAIAYLDELEVACLDKGRWSRGWKEPDEALASVRAFRAALRNSAEKEGLFKPRPKVKSRRHRPRRPRQLYTPNTRRFHSGTFQIEGNSRGEVFCPRDLVCILTGPAKGNLGLVRSVVHHPRLKRVEVTLNGRESGMGASGVWYSPESLELVPKKHEGP